MLDDVSSVSHANAAVDEALKDVANQLRATLFYNEGKLVRLGIPQSGHFEKLTEKFPLVLLDKIAAKLGESLSKEKRELEKKKRSGLRTFSINMTPYFWRFRLSQPYLLSWLPLYLSYPDYQASFLLPTMNLDD